MKRRTSFKAVLATFMSAYTVQAKEPSIELQLDLSVDPAREKEMLKNFHDVFRPAASKQPGFIDSKMLKLNSALQGSAPAGANYRFMISFATEGDRKKWVATAVHQRVWPLIENALSSKNYTVLLYEVS